MPVFERAKTVHALDHAAAVITVIEWLNDIYFLKIYMEMYFISRV
jgi:hypothetical protein